MSVGTIRWDGCRPLLAFLVVFSAVVMAQPQLSLDDLRRETTQHPDSTEAWINLGNGYLGAGDYDKAKDSFLEAIGIDYRAGDAHFGLGLAEFERGDFQSALFSFGEVTRLYPDRFDGHYNQAVTLARLRRYDEAAAAFRAAIAQAEPEAEPEDVMGAYLGLASQLKQAGNFEEAARAYSDALALTPENAELAYLHADALYQAGRGLDALPELTDLEPNTSDYRVSALIADIYVEEGQVDYALRSLDRALKKADSAGEIGAEANLYIKLGLLQRRLGREAEAARSFQRATQSDDGSWEAFYNLGVSYLESGQTRSALDALRKAIDINGDSGEVYLALATAYDQLAKTSEALDNAQAAIQRLTDTTLATEARFIVARALYRQEDFAGARQMMTQVLQAQPNNAQAQLWAGLVEYQQGNYSAAVQYYERAVQLDPDSVEARINLGAAYLASQRYQDAEFVYQLLVQQNPRDAESYYNLGWALLSQDHRGAAKDAWQHASELGYQPAVAALTQYF